MIVVYKLVQPIQFSALTDNFLTQLTQSYYVGHPRQLSRGTGEGDEGLVKV